ncbi:MAG: hypothetical protein JSR58_06880 [Verrucomicrobia bacterium]|nr:hypothetical protein [Verrucomicrobiota bacterium]
MSYPLSDPLHNIAEKGLARLRKAVEIIIPEIPRLQKDFFSPDEAVKEKARKEIAWLLTELDRLAAEAAKESGRPAQVLWQELVAGTSLSPQDRAQLAQIQKVVREKKEEIQPPKKKKRPRPPETHIKG